MSGILSAPHGAHGGGPAELASQLWSIADDAEAAANLADGEYLPQMPRGDELRRSFSGAGRAAALLDGLRARISKLDAGEDGQRLAQQAIAHLEAGREALLDGVVEGHDPAGRRMVSADAVATAAAGGMFRDAAVRMRAIADLASLQSVRLEDLFDAITGPRA